MTEKESLKLQKALGLVMTIESTQAGVNLHRHGMTHGKIARMAEFNRRLEAILIETMEVN